MRQTLAAFLLTIAASRAAWAAPKPAIRVTLAADAVTIDGATPNAPVLLVEAVIVLRQYSPRTVTRELPVTTDAAGHYRFALPEPATGPLFIAVVDESTGAVATAASTQRVHIRPLTPAAFRNNAQGEAVGLDVPFDIGKVVVVRPGVGAWQGRAGGQPVINGRVAFGIGDLKGVGRGGPAGPPPKLEKGDVVILVHPISLAAYVGSME